jgi:lipid-binding SYLF domain-containing protein
MRNLLCNSFDRLLLVCFALVLFPVAPIQAASSEDIDAEVATALKEFRTDVQGADEYLKEAKGVLVIPNVKKVGFVIAAQWGTGALQVGGHNVGYYKMDAGSAGFQAGYQKANFVFIFFTNEALNKFRSSEGWTVGAEAGLTLVEVSGGVGADTLKNRDAVAGFAFGKEGLMGGWSAKGTKFSRVEPER